MCRLAVCAVAVVTLVAVRAQGAEKPAANEWTLVDADQTGSRVGPALVYVPTFKQVVLTGGNLVGEAAYAQGLDAESLRWSALVASAPTAGTPPRAGAMSSLVSAPVACDTDTGRVYFLANDRLVVFDAAAKAWSSAGDAIPVRLLFPTMAYDPVNKQLIVVGCGTTPEEIGWTVALAFDPAKQVWGRPKFVQEQRPAEDRPTAFDLARWSLDGLAGLVGRIRHIWYRDPKGEGTSDERTALLVSIATRDGGVLDPFKQHGAEMKKIADLITARQLLAALEAARDLQSRVRREVEAGAPAPPARARSPIVCDPVNKVLVLFGGDRQESMVNDTWLLDLTTGAWRRAKPRIAPSPRAGHSLVYLPRAGKIALWDGYRQRDSLEYWSAQWEPLPQRELWLYDVKADRWDLLRTWDWSSKMTPGSRDEPSRMAPDRVQPVYLGFPNDVGDYRFTPLAADAADVLVVTAPGPTALASRQRLNATWVLPVDASRIDAAATKALGVAPDQEVRRPGKYLASYCDSAAPSPDLKLDALKPNVWMPLPEPARNPLGGQRKKDWSTAVWNPDAGEVLYFGGGHCNGAYTAPIHWSPLSNRFAEGYDTDEQYGHNGARGTSLMGRPWVYIHGYLDYDYDPVAKRLVLVKINGFTYLYDPVRMDWERRPIPNPFYGHPYQTAVNGTPHGAVAYALRDSTGGEKGAMGLWRFDAQAGWQALPRKGQLPPTATDGHASCYESRRDRLIHMSAPGYGIQCDGSVGFYDFKTGDARTAKPANAELGAVRPSIREMVYVEHADVALLLKEVRRDGKTYYPALDCAAERWMLLDLGAGPNWNHGMVYDPKRQLIFVIGPDGQRWALKLDLATVEGIGRQASDS
jgi:hypothetical protein